jgi:penicillin-binding protein 1A
MLGLDYGAQSLVLPSWRVEGATNPFVLRMFPGWLSYIAYPFWVVYAASFILLYQLLPYIWGKVVVEETLLLNVPHTDFLFVAVLGIWSVLSLYVYRSNLFDIHENRRLSCARIIAKLLKLSLARNFEYLIYRARLAMHETRRNKVPLENLRKALVFIEDRSFYSHRGVSLRGTSRALLGIVRLKRRSGGSTITQQLVRTLFISDLHKTIRRKLVEYPLAYWFDVEIGKSELLEIYLSSVRFANGVYGVPAALKHFFGGRLDQSISMAKAFFLIERVSNVRDGILLDKIKHTSRQMLDEGLLSKTDIHDLKKIYARMVKKRLLRPINKHDFDTWCQ